MKLQQLDYGKWFYRYCHKSECETQHKTNKNKNLINLLKTFIIPQEDETFLWWKENLLLLTRMKINIFVIKILCNKYRQQLCVVMETFRFIFRGISLRLKGHHLEILYNFCGLLFLWEKSKDAKVHTTDLTVSFI